MQQGSTVPSTDPGCPCTRNAFRQNSPPVIQMACLWVCIKQGPYSSLECGVGPGHVWSLGTHLCSRISVHLQGSGPSVSQSLSARSPAPVSPGSVWGREKDSPRLYQSRKCFRLEFLRGLCSRSGQPGGKGVRDQGPVRGLLSPRKLDKGQGEAFRPICVPQGERARPEGWHSRKHQEHWRHWEAQFLVLVFDLDCTG